MEDPLKIAFESALYLADLIQDNGAFRYRYNIDKSRNESGYNILRHAGAIWSILDVYKDTLEKKFLDVCNRAVEYMFNEYLKLYHNNICICEKNKIKLGANALAILALSNLHVHTSKQILLDISYLLADFILNQRKEDGNFIHKIYFNSGVVSTFNSSYYVGEALLALLTLYDITKDHHLIIEARDIEMKLAGKNYGIAEQSHWMLYFISSLIKFDNSPIFYQHAKKIVKSILDNPLYLSWDRSTPIACRSEGLLAFLLIPPIYQDDALRSRIMAQVNRNLNLQLSYRQPNGSFIRGGYGQRKNEIRIDYLQHNISSFLFYSRLKKLY